MLMGTIVQLYREQKLLNIMKTIRQNSGDLYWQNVAHEQYNILSNLPS